jgi:hypothetical protein
MTVPQLSNDRWSLDFVADQFIDGRRMRILVAPANAWHSSPTPRSCMPMGRGSTACRPRSREDSRRAIEHDGDELFDLRGLQHEIHHSFGDNSMSLKPAENGLAIGAITVANDVARCPLPPGCLGQLAGNPFRRCERCAFAIGRSQCGRHGRTDARSGSSHPSGGIALIMSLCLSSDTFVICSRHIESTTTRPVRICHWRKTRRSRAPFRPSVKRWPCPSWVGSTIDVSEREFPTGTPGELGSAISQALKANRHVIIAPLAVS